MHQVIHIFHSSTANLVMDSGSFHQLSTYFSCFPSRYFFSIAHGIIFSLRGWFPSLCTSLLLFYSITLYILFRYSGILVFPFSSSQKLGLWSFPICNYYKISFFLNPVRLDNLGLLPSLVLLSGALFSLLALLAWLAYFF